MSVSLTICLNFGCLLALLSFPAAHGFQMLVFPSPHILKPTCLAMNIHSANESSSENENDNLVLGGDDLQTQMSKLRSKFPTSEADYLAAARARNLRKVESQNNLATDEDFQQIAREKAAAQQRGEESQDDWEKAESEDSGLLFYPTSDENDEPTLLL